jgi:hypothetical protein
MEEWGDAAHELLKAQSLTATKLEAMMRDAMPHFGLRVAADAFMRRLEKAKVPLLIFSAGIGNVIELSLRLLSLNSSNVHIVSNFLSFSDSGSGSGSGSGNGSSSVAAAAAKKGTPQTKRQRRRTNSGKGEGKGGGGGSGDITDPSAPHPQMGRSDEGDGGGECLGFLGENIHVFNKNESNLKNTVYYEEAAARRNVCSATCELFCLCVLLSLVRECAHTRASRWVLITTQPFRSTKQTSGCLLGDRHVVYSETDTKLLITYYRLFLQYVQVLLLGDSLGDVDMAAGIPHSTVLKVGFLNTKVSQDVAALREQFSAVYDVVLVGDLTFDYANELLAEILK